MVAGAPRLWIRNLFLVALAAVHLVAFVSLASQVPYLLGSGGLLPVRSWVETLHAHASWVRVPTLFWGESSNAVLQGAAALGAALSLALGLGVAPRVLLMLLWFLYLSFVSVGQDCLAFQWDNLLLEATFLACFVAPWRHRELRTPPSTAGVFLLQWLLVRLHVESGLTTLLSGDPSWAT